VTPARSIAVRAAVIATAFYAVFTIILVIPNGGRAEWFVKFGEQGPITDYAHQVLRPDVVTPYDEGQDGTTFWLHARDPLLTDPGRYTTLIDRPTYRAQRVLYPALTAPFRLAGEQGLLWGLVLVNLAVVFVGTLLTSLLAIELRAPPRAAYVFALNTLMVVAFVQDLSDGLAVVGVLATLLAVRRKRWGCAVLAGVVAVLAKEQALLPIVAVALVARGPRPSRAALVAGPAAAAGLWALYLRIRLGWPATSIEEFTAVPFSAFVDSYRFGWSVTGRYGEMLVALAIVVVSVVVVVRFWRRRRQHPLELAACLPSVLLVPFYSSQVIYRDINSIRAIGPVLTLLALDLYAGRAPRRSTAGNTRPAVT
jgi:hypothetical protein